MTTLASRSDPSPDVRKTDEQFVTPSADSASRRKADVFLVLASRLLTEGLSEVLSHEEDVRLAGTFPGRPAVSRGASRLRDCVVVVDAALANADPSLLPAISAAGRGVKIVLLMSTPDDQQVLRALQLGVRGVVLESMGVRLLVNCIRKVHAGEEWIEQSSASRLLHRFAIQDAAEGSASLTRREIETLRGVARGLSNAEIAAELSIHPATVKTHVHNVFRKLEVDSRVAVANWARARGLL
jgi:two-component system nitrate/nitrite response regulator NarL